MTVARGVRSSTDRSSCSAGRRRQHCRSLRWLFAPPGQQPADWSITRAKRVEATIRDDRSIVLVTEVDQQLAGFATVYLDLVSVRFGQRAWVEDLAVAPDRRSQDVGHALLERAKSWARDRGAKRLGLESGAVRLDAHRFYEREQPDGHSRSFHWQL